MGGQVAEKEDIDALCASGQRWRLDKMANRIAYVRQAPHTHTHTHTHTEAHTQMHARTHARTRKHTHTHTHTNSLRVQGALSVCVCVCVPGRMRACALACACACACEGRAALRPFPLPSPCLHGYVWVPDSGFKVQGLGFRLSPGGSRGERQPAEARSRRRAATASRRGFLREIACRYTYTRT